MSCNVAFCRIFLSTHFKDVEHYSHKECTHLLTIVLRMFLLNLGLKQNGVNEGMTQPIN